MHSTSATEVDLHRFVAQATKFEQQLASVTVSENNHSLINTLHRSKYIINITASFKFTKDFLIADSVDALTLIPLLQLNKK